MDDLTVDVFGACGFCFFSWSFKEIQHTGLSSILVEIRQICWTSLTSFSCLFLFCFCSCFYLSPKTMSHRVALPFVCASHSFCSVLHRRWPRYWITRESTPSSTCPCSRPQTASWWTWKGSTVSTTSKRWWTSSKRGETGRAVVCFSSGQLPLAYAAITVVKQHSTQETHYLSLLENILFLHNIHMTFATD